MDIQGLATQIVKKLQEAGYIAYFAGGWVRDLVMQHPSSDVDIATDAPPEKILDLFPKTVHVGLAFGVVVVSIEGQSFEVATFRKDIGIHDGRKPLRIEPASAQEDASRRDFTINGMFYDPIKNAIYDYVCGMEDIKKQLIRTIGDPNDRFVEDRLRMIRAIRFAARFGFNIDPETQEAILENAPSLFPAVSMERIWQELQKMAAGPRFEHALLEMHRLKLLPTIFPELMDVHLNELKERIQHFSQFPPSFPAIGYLLELFSEKNGREVEDLCRYLKTSTKEIKFAQFVLKARRLFKEEYSSRPPDRITWTYFYAHPASEQMLKLHAAHINESERHLFFSLHKKRKKALSFHIERIQKKSPLVTAADLKKKGILPGKQMGDLLKEAERISINQQLFSAEQVISYLMHSPYWPKELI